MAKFFESMTAVTILIVIVFVGAFFSGTILWILYPHIHILFPTAASNGIIANSLQWWDSVCICWIFGILIKGSNTSSSKKD